MPFPVAILAPGSIAAAKSLAFQASTYLDSSLVYYVGTATFWSVVFHRIVWKRLPEWVREDLMIGSLWNHDESSSAKQQHQHQQSQHGEETLGSIVDKLQKLVESASQNENMQPVPQLHAALLAYIQLSGQFKEKQLEKNPGETAYSPRDALFQSAGPSQSLHNSSSSTKELCEALQFATWAYYNDTQSIKERLQTSLTDSYTLLKHSSHARPGNVDYYIALSHERKQVVIGIKGTSTLGDLLTDCCGRAVPLESLEDRCCQSRIEVQAQQPDVCHYNNHCYEDDEGDASVEIESGHERITVVEHHHHHGRTEHATFGNDHDDHGVFCHEGILRSSERLVDRIQSIVQRLVLESGYRILLCGHSLGGGAAAIAGVILRSRFPELCDNVDLSPTTTIASTEKRLHVYAFAPPPVLDHDSAVAASSFCTTMMNNADIIPRCSLVNVIVFFEFLKHVHARLVEHKINPTGPRSTAGFLKQLAKGTSGDMLLSAQEIQSAMEQAHDKVELRQRDHLYIPGSVLCMYVPWGQQSLAEDMTSLLVQSESKEEKKEDVGQLLAAAAAQEKLTNDGMAREAIQCTLTDGTAKVMRSFEFDGLRMFTDHLTASYYQCLGMEYQY